MRNRARIGIGIFSAALVSAFALTGCGDKCSSDDLDCVLAHIVVVRPENGSTPMELRSISGSAVTTKAPPATAKPGGGCASGTQCNNLCVNTAWDANNCGSCGNVCPATEQCISGSCQCGSGKSFCGSSCVDLSRDPNNCGGCGISCGGGYCSASSCQSQCPTGTTLCNGACVDTMSDSANCGSCGSACGAGESCQSGSCACTNPQYACGCIDPTTDAANCGGCGQACASGQICQAGMCCTPGTPGCGSGGDPSMPSGPPAITNQPDAMDFSDPSELQPLELDYTDPYGCRPATCFQVCSGGRCSSGFMCAPPEHDNLTSGTWRSYLGFLAEPADSTMQLTTDAVMVSGPNCDDSILDRLENGDVDVSISNTVSIDVTIESPNTYDSSGSGSGYSGGGTEQACSDSTAVCNCSVMACATSDGACWYETSNGTYNCGAGCDCQAAANAIVSACCPH